MSIPAPSEPTLTFRGPPKKNGESFVSSISAVVVRRSPLAPPTKVFDDTNDEFDVFVHGRSTGENKEGADG